MRSGLVGTLVHYFTCTTIFMFVFWSPRNRKQKAGHGSEILHCVIIISNIKNVNNPRSHAPARINKIFSQFYNNAQRSSWLANVRFIKHLHNENCHCLQQCRLCFVDVILNALLHHGHPIKRHERAFVPASLKWRHLIDINHSKCTYSHLMELVMHFACSCKLQLRKLEYYCRRRWTYHPSLCL